MTTRSYAGQCHCGAVKFQLTSEPITGAVTCNCSICIRRGATMSALYYAPTDVAVTSGPEALVSYKFGDGDVEHLFCGRCGIAPFSRVASVPADYPGPARPGDYRINLGCLDDVDHAALEITRIDGKSF